MYHLNVLVMRSLTSLGAGLKGSIATVRRECLQRKKPLILIVAFAFSINVDPRLVLATTLPPRLKQDLIEARDILPILNGKSMVSLCPDSRFTLKPPKSLDNVRDLA